MGGNPAPRLAVRAAADLVRDGWGCVAADLSRDGSVAITATPDDGRGEWGEEASWGRLLGADAARLGRLSTPVLRERFVASRWLIKRAVGEVVGADPADLELGYGLTGRPYVRGLDQVDVSLTHTDDVLLVGLTGLGSIGVDVEPAGRRLLGSGVERMMCSPHELEVLAALPEATRDRWALRIWTLKEAYSKALGQGLQFSFTEFGFDLDPDPDAPSGRVPEVGVRLCRADGTPVTAQAGGSWTFRSAGAGAFLIAVAVRATTGRPRDLRSATVLDPRLLAAASRAASLR